jgi:predicted RNA binding protein YcfA (HicA-like mRNA interferase family)
MSKLEKLIAHLRSEPTEASFSDVQKILEHLNFVEVRASGSHHVFRDQNGRMIVVPKKSGSKVKKVYIKKVINLLDSDRYE